jgi:predicted phosphohydrolase
MKLAWCTDIHQDFLSPYKRELFLNDMVAAQADAFLITGDISTARDLEEHLSLIVNKVNVPIYYVLGNHDYWHGSVEGVRALTVELEQKFPNLIYLGNRSYVKMSEDTALVGHDAWYDAVNGEWKNSGFEMPDWYYIKEFADAGCAQFYGRGHWMFDIPRVVGQSKALAAFCANHIEKGIAEALAAGFKKIIVATHVPPFPEAHMHEGKQGDDAAQPWFTSGLLGDVLDGSSITHPDNVFVSFSGHTHGEYHGSRRNNLHVHVGGAHYGRPHVQTLIHL